MRKMKIHEEKKPIKRKIVTWTYGLKILKWTNQFATFHEEKKPSRWIGMKINEFDASIDYNEDAHILKYIIKYIDFMV